MARLDAGLLFSLVCKTKVYILAQMVLLHISRNADYRLSLNRLTVFSHYNSVRAMC